MAIDRRTFLGVSGAALCAGVALFAGGRPVEAQRENFPFRLQNPEYFVQPCLGSQEFPLFPQFYIQQKTLPI